MIEDRYCASVSVPQSDSICSEPKANRSIEEKFYIIIGKISWILATSDCLFRLIDCGAVIIDERSFTDSL